MHLSNSLFATVLAFMAFDQAAAINPPKNSANHDILNSATGTPAATPTMRAQELARRNSGRSLSPPHTAPCPFALLGAPTLRMAPPATAATSRLEPAGSARWKQDDPCLFLPRLFDLRMTEEAPGWAGF
ncbi:hypothetical protein CSUB01_06818 [Colletotrichum sublineola]|uniref:Uncharacterized protein n=1 Tax=Colletotrichum sublineola TaxID=1173701 RepID=A0A066XE76_COLSU|nr:hypothetical protein CSUB01_06818 [Colletotrichum sublineola]